MDLKTFESVIATIRGYDVKKEKLSNVLEEVFLDSYAIISMGGDLINILIKITASQIGCEADDLSWWLYEDVEKVLFLKDKQGEYTSEHSVKTPKQFYDYYKSRK